MKCLLGRFIADKSAATAIEYSLVAGLIAVVIIASLHLLSGNISAKYNSIAANLSS